MCYTNYEGGSDCSTTYHDYLKHEWKGYWFYGPFDELRGCLDLPCDVIGEVQESEIIWYLIGGMLMSKEKNNSIDNYI